jgi:predicted GIY-YIG superfamily endonuclease
MLKGYIYIHITPNNKVYIGQTTQDLKKRFLNGKEYSSCSLFQKAINKYGKEASRCLNGLLTILNS